MQDAYAFLDQLTFEDKQWWLIAGEERQLQKDDALIRKESPVESVYFVVRGLLGIFSDNQKAPLAQVGPGSILGEMSYLENSRASATVKALEPTEVLGISKAALDEKIKEEPDFGSRLFQTLARILSHRLRQSQSHSQLNGQATNDTQGESFKTLSEKIKVFKQSLLEIEKNSAPPSEAIFTKLQTELIDLLKAIEQKSNSSEGSSECERSEFGAYAHIELLPFLKLPHLSHRCIKKPRGYSGDYLILDHIFQNQPKGTGKVGEFFDRLLLATPAMSSLRHRKEYLTDTIATLIESRNFKNTSLTNLHCGPAREILDLLAKNPELPVEVNCIDTDALALDYIRKKKEGTHFQKQIQLINENLMYLALGKKKIKLKNKHLVYGINLLDSYNDNLAVKLLDWVFEILAPGGKLVFGTFHTQSSQKALMDFLLKWEVFHRNEEQIGQLFMQSLFKKAPDKVALAPDGLSLLVECIRPD